ncbi:hypothetical protein C8R44DRAFT_883429 [Mycena epipterygia]|nr:hypothetical protein C8R44DRAFT_883429 [Mycena epipterygia]
METSTSLEVVIYPLLALPGFHSSMVVLPSVRTAFAPFAGVFHSNMRAGVVLCYYLSDQQISVSLIYSPQFHNLQAIMCGKLTSSWTHSFSNPFRSLRLGNWTYFKPRRSAGAQLMLPDGALKSRSKGTAAVFRIICSFLPPVISLSRKIFGPFVLNTLL